MTFNKKVRSIKNLNYYKKKKKFINIQSESFHLNMSVKNLAFIVFNY